MCVVQVAHVQSRSKMQIKSRSKHGHKLELDFNAAIIRSRSKCTDTVEHCSVLCCLKSVVHVSDFTFIWVGIATVQNKTSSVYQNVHNPGTRRVKTEINYQSSKY